MKIIAKIETEIAAAIKSACRPTKLSVKYKGNATD